MSSSGGLWDYQSKSQQAKLSESYKFGEGRSQGATASDASGWVGWTVFAAVILMLMGTFHLIQGLVALFKDDYFAVSSSGLVLSVSYTTWGWIHIVGGAIAIAAGVALFSGKMWARIFGTAMACLSAIASIGFLAAHPVWAAVVIFLDVAIIMALTVHGSEIKDY